MRNHIQAALYLLARNAAFKFTVFLTAAIGVLRGVLVLVSPPASLSVAPQVQVLGGALPYLSCIAAVGLVASDQARGAVRMACLGERGRSRYAASRMLAAGLAASLVVLVQLALDLLWMAVLPEASYIAAYPAGNAPETVVGHWLCIVALAELCVAAALLLNASGATAVLLPFALVLLLMGVPILVVWAVQGLLPEALSPVGHMREICDLLPVRFLMDVSAADPSGQIVVVEPGVLSLYLVPVVWTAASCALVRWRMARRAL